MLESTPPLRPAPLPPIFRQPDRAASDFRFMPEGGIQSGVRVGPPTYGALTTAERLVIVLRRLMRDADSVVTLDDFKAEPETAELSATEVAAHIGEAKRLFGAEQAAADALIRRESRLRTARQIVLGLFPDAGQVHAALRNAGFEVAEEADLWPELIAQSADEWDFTLSPSGRA